jgi:hypothetical protein
MDGATSMRTSIGLLASSIRHPRPFEKADVAILRTVLVSGEFYLRSICDREASSPISGGREKSHVNAHATKQQGHA